ncbi:MAG TPA: dihydrodipicolinate synthase family protein [Verrucomicrobiae bacterium]|nr:dihydrodipicolinate synthase family protein [Verrucomicrobiae bacterium]
MHEKWNGIVAALWTPMKSESELDATALRTNVAFLKQQGIHGILALGSTGEFLYLSPALRKEVMQKVVACADGLPVVCNISDIRHKVVADLGKHAQSVGASAVALLPPYYYSFAQADLVEWYVRAGEEVRLPLFIYNFPERTGNPLSLNTIEAITDQVPIAGIKQSGGDFSYHGSLAQLGRKKNFVVFTGSDTRIAEAMELGACGCMGGLANGIPDLMVEVYAAVRSGNVERVRLCSERVSEVGHLVDTVGFPTNIAALIEARGHSAGRLKSITSADTLNRFRRLKADLRDLFEKWGLSCNGHDGVAVVAADSTTQQMASR